MACKLSTALEEALEAWQGVALHHLLRHAEPEIDDQIESNRAFIAFAH